MNRLVLETRLKLLDDRKAKVADKHGLDQGDVEQLHTYGHSLLDGQVDVEPPRNWRRLGGTSGQPLRGRMLTCRACWQHA